MQGKALNQYVLGAPDPLYNFYEMYQKPGIIDLHAFV